MTQAEQNYDIHDKELLAVVNTLEHWRVYVESSSELTVLTDHKNLTTFTITKKLNRQQVRWAELLGQHKFKILYTPGQDNRRADALSWQKDHIEDDEHQGIILQQDQQGNLVPQPQINKLTAEDTEELTRNYHDNPAHSHPGISKTTDLIQQAGNNVINLWQHVTNYISKCLLHQKNKHGRYKLYRERHPNTILSGPWEDMSMDFITKLPKSKDPVTGITYNLIMVIVDRFTKYLIAVLFKETHTAEQLGHLLLDRLVRDHRVLIMIITDRDKLFTSNYWKTISAAMGTKPKMSTAYHPWTDSQTEWANQVLETYLQHYINQTHSNWVQLLPVAQLAINQHRSDSTKESLFFANFGQHANIGMPSRASPNTEKALQHDKLLRQTHTMMRHYLQETSERM